MAKNGSLILYNYIGTGGYIGSSVNPNSSPTYFLDLAKTTFSWTVVNQDIVTNTSTINWTLTVENLGNYSVTSLKIDEFYIYDNRDNSRLFYSGNAVDVTSNSSAYSGSFTFNHNDDGTLSIPLKFKAFMSATMEAGNSYSSMSAIDNAITTITLDNIPRHAVLLTAPERFTDEDSPTITFAIPNVATNVRAYIAFNTSTIDIGSYAISGSSYTFRFTDAEKHKLWSILDDGLNTKQVYFYVMSEFQGTLYHSDPIISTLEVINYTPTIAPEVYDTNEAAIALTGDSFKLIRYISNATWKTGAKANKGATIVTQSVANGGKTYYGASGTIEGVTSPNFDFAAIDSYGRSITSNYNVAFAAGYWIEYVKLTCSSEVTEMTADGDVKVTLKGKYFDGNFGAKSNRMRMHYDITKDGDEMEHVDKGYIYPTINGSDYTYEFTISGLDYMSVYNVTVRVSDEVSVEGTETQLILASTPIFDWGRTDFNFNVPVNINGDLTLTGDITANGNTVPTIVAQGTAGIWTYRTWSDGTAECWGKKDFTVNVTSAWGSMYTSGAISGSNISFPFGLFAETPIVNASLLVRSAGGILMAPGGAGSNIASMDQTGVYEIARGTSLSNAAYTINYDVKGRWK